MEKTKKILISLLLLCFLTSISLAQPEEVKELKNISVQKLENQLNVSVVFDEGITYESFTLFNPNRLVIDLINGEKISAEPLYEVDSFGVLQIRAAINRPGIIRVVFDFEDKLPLYRIEEVETGLEISFWHEEPAEMVEEKPPVKIEEEKKPVEVTAKPEEEKIEPRPSIIQERRMATRETLAEKEWNMSIGILSGFYFMQDEAFKDVYGSSSFFFGGEYSFIIPVKEFKRALDASISFKYLRKTGLTTYTEEELRFRMTHFSFSVRYLIDLKKFTPFIGPGIDYIVYKETYPETFPIESVGSSDVGFHIQGGTYFELTPALFARAYFKFNISKTLSEDIEVNLGGIEWGLGIAFRF